MTRIAASHAAAVHSTKSHFPGTVKSAGWAPGSGIRRPDGKSVYMGLFANVQGNPTTKYTSKTTVDAAKKTVTVTLTGTKGRANKLADREQNLKLGTPTGMQMGTTYKLVIKDSTGHVLSRSSFNPVPAP